MSWLLLVLLLLVMMMLGSRNSTSHQHVTQHA
jgi:hypothetical protein